MQAKLGAFGIPKRGSSDSEYEDAFAPLASPSDENPLRRFAVADGATECSYSKQWAASLVSNSESGRLVLSSCDESLPQLQAEWHEEIRVKDLPWFAAEKANQGAFAALLALEIRPDENGDGRGDWCAEAVGDTCLFQIRGDDLLTRFPLQSAAEFNVCPFLVGTTSPTSAIAEHIKQISGTWELGDEFLLMTDALAYWFLEEVEAARQPWVEMRGFSAVDSFRVWVGILRENRALRNDDTTLLRIDLT